MRWESGGICAIILTGLSRRSTKATSGENLLLIYTLQVLPYIPPPNTNSCLAVSEVHVVSDQVWGENASRSYVLTKYAIDLYPSCLHTHVLYNWHCRGRCNHCRGIWLSQFSLVCSWDPLCMGTKSSHSSCRLPWWWHESYMMFDYCGSWTSSSSIHPF